MGNRNGRMSRGGVEVNEEVDTVSIVRILLIMMSNEILMKR